MLERMLGPDDFDLLPHVVALSIAYALAFPIGWNREHEERSAGLRTFPLVAVATCGFIQASEALTGNSPEAMARIVEGLITGMGFIGGGAILRLEDSVKGTATAASLWVTGAIGMSVGLGSLDVAVMLSLVTAATLWVMSPLKRIGGLEPKKEAAEDKKSRRRGKPD
jgi:putative Mg2+ transporter-C (MgtC) family protein